jgi:L-ascorbate metabolism protein UlaG (beta-lactamase superfamily)
MRTRLALSLALLAAWGCSPSSRSSSDKPRGGKIAFTPIRHASVVIRAPGTTIYVDPVGKAETYGKFPAPDIILITHAHGDHLAPELVKSLRRDRTAVIAPREVVDKLGFGSVLANGGRTEVRGVGIEAIPMYNTTKERLKFHPKGRGNGYVLKLAGSRIYISGDTEDIPEMRALRDIDYAFVCMNLPYTMTVEQAASAVLEMKPRVVIPYHYRGRRDGKPVFSDLGKFRRLVAADPNIEVRLLEWYK